MAHELGHVMTFDESAWYENLNIAGEHTALKIEEIKAWEKARSLLTDLGVFGNCEFRFVKIKKQTPEKKLWSLFVNVPKKQEVNMFCSR